MNKQRIADSTKRILREIGEDLGREGVKETPERVAEMLEELTSGYRMDPKEILSNEWSEVTGMVVAKDIEFFSLCEHHLLPFYGKVHIGYIPNKGVVGLSKLVRLVECFSKRLQLQERMTKQLADSINRQLKPLGVMIVIEARHLCMQMRGVRNGANIVTSEIRGQFEKYETRSEFLGIIGKGTPAAG